MARPRSRSVADGLVASAGNLPRSGALVRLARLPLCPR